jgi:hypothetical protein
LPQAVKSCTDLKKNKYHIMRAWLLLLCFAAGQYEVYAHQHNVGRASKRSVYHSVNAVPQQTVTENCQLCDTMHHNAMAVNSQVFFAPVAVSNYTYKAVSYNFISIALVLAAGRAPPLA